MKIKTLKLKNGIRVAVVPVSGLRSVTVEVFFKIGSKYEKRDEFGLSHFLEHMAFKGTQKRPTAADINKEIDSKGAIHNATTEQEHTSYYITTIKENIPWAVELLSDMLINSVFDKDEVLKEKGVIKQEIRMFHDNPMRDLSGELVKFLYGKSKIGCWDIAGEVDDIEKINKDKVVGYRNKLINPDNIVVVIAGNVDYGAFGEVEKYFSDFGLGKDNLLPNVDIVLNSEKRKEIVRPVEQGHFAMAVPALKRNDDRRYAFKLLNLILSGGSSSRLFEKIREDRGLAYYIFPVSESFVEVGFWGVQSGVKVSKMDEAMEIVRQEITGIGENVKDDEVKRAKDYFIGVTKLRMDESDYWSGLIGEHLLLDNELVSLDDELDKYNKVPKKEISALAKELFKKEEIRQVIIKNK